MTSHPMKVLIGCEKSGITRQAFNKHGITDVTSVDLLPAEDNSPNHIQGDVLKIIEEHDFNVFVGYPPCTELSNIANKSATRMRDTVDSGTTSTSRQFITARRNALKLFIKIMNNPKIVVGLIENPVGRAGTILHMRQLDGTVIKAPSEIVEPWQFADKNLSNANLNDLHCKRTALFPFGNLDAVYRYPMPINHSVMPSATQRNWVLTTQSSIDRSRTPPGMADAIAYIMKLRFEYAIQHYPFQQQCKWFINPKFLLAPKKYCNTPGCTLSKYHLGNCTYNDKKEKKSNKKIQCKRNPFCDKPNKHVGRCKLLLNSE